MKLALFRKRIGRLVSATVMAMLIVMTMTPLTTDAVSSEELALVNLINQYRASKGLGKLALSDRLYQAAYKHSTDMATKDYFSHTSLNGATYKDRIAASGYPTNTWLGENIAAGKSRAADTFTQWKNSPGHNSLMLNKNFKAIGIGRVYGAGSKYKYYWTADFGGVIDSTAKTDTTTPPAPPQTETQTKEAAQAAEKENWAYDYIQALAKQGAMSGYPDGTFKPDKPVTRAEFCAITARALKIAPGGSKTFRDAKKHWAKGYIAALAARGCVDGYVDGRFRPDDSISRAEIAKIMCKVAELKLSCATQKQFTDVASHWAKDSIKIASCNGVMNGYPDGRFKPARTCARSEAAASIYRLMNK